MKMKQLLKHVWDELGNMVKTVTPAQAIAWELAEAEMALLKAETCVEYAQASVTYNKNRIKRLRNYISATTEEPKETT
jgi:hypothetical protein